MHDLPSGLTTMIGSLPHDNVADALATLEQFPLSIPAWPQLPRRSFREWFIPQCVEGLPGLLMDDDEKTVRVDLGEDGHEAMAGAYESVLAGDCEAFAMSNEHAAGLYAFVERHAGRDLPAVKGHLIGPFSLGLSLHDQAGKPVWWDRQYRDLLVKALALKGLWQMRQLARCGQRALMFFDEPLLMSLGTPALMGVSDQDVIETIDEVIEPARQARALTGMHCCGNTDWAVVMRTRLDIIAFDAYGFGDRLVLYAEHVERFLRRGGYLAWGLVPTGDAELARSETADSLLRRRDDLLAQFAAKGVDESLLRARMLYTPSCGLGTLPPATAEHVLKVLAELGR